MNIDVRDAVSPLLVLLLLLGVAVTRTAAVAVTLPKDLRSATVQMPRAWLNAVDALDVANAQTGLRYAVLPPSFKGVVGPYRIQEPVTLDKLLQAIADATGCSLRTVNDVIVFDPNPGKPETKADRQSSLKAPAADTKAAQVLAMALAGHSRSIPALSTLAGDADASVRYQALAALHALEGDFLRNQWPGRVSIFEVLRPELDRDSLYFALQECHAPASPGWCRIVDILARAREPYLARNTWAPAFERTPGTIQLSLWALGRSGDHTARATLAKRVRRSFTSDPADRYLAAAALGLLNDAGTLNGKMKEVDPRENKGKTDLPEVRAAILYGFAHCRPSDSLHALVEKYLDDADPRVRFMACYTLGRLAAPAGIARLTAILRDAKAAPDLQGAAIEGLFISRDPAGLSALIEAAASPAPWLRAPAADALGRLGGARARDTLLPMLDDADAHVRSSAACGLATLGTPEAIARIATWMSQPASDDEARIAAIIGLGRSLSPDAVTALRPIAIDPRQPRRLRQYAVIALSSLARRAGQPTLKSITTYDSPEYVSLALRYLDLGDPAETFDYVKGFLARGFNDTSGTAACRLAESGYGPAIRELLEGSDVFENHARMMHMWGAIRSAGPQAVPALVESCASRRSDIRQGAAFALGNRVDIRAVDALIALAADPAARVRSAAAQSMGITGDPKALPTLIRLAETDESDSVFSTAIRALRMWAFRGHPEVKALFTRLAGTPRDIGLTGVPSPSVRQQPDHSFVLRQSAGSLDDEDMCNITYESSLAYDSGRGRTVLWGAHGRRADFPQTGETWFYDAAASDWERLISSREIPNETCCVWGTVYDAANRLVVSPVSGGRGGHGWINWLRSDMQYSLPWILDTRTDQWYPARPLGHKGGIGQVGSSFDPSHGVVAFWHGKTTVYDGHANQWLTRAPSEGAPDHSNNAGAQFDPETGRLIVISADSTWALEPTSERWINLKPAGAKPPPGRMVYDSANRVMLVFGRAAQSEGVQVWVYHIAENRWEELPSVSPTPHYHGYDVAYDSRNNVAVINGGWQTGRSGETTIRETWTYRYKAAQGPRDPFATRPADGSVQTRAGGKAALAWKAPAAGAPAKYRVYRGAGEKPWTVEWKPLGEVPPSQLQFEDTGVDTAKPLVYKIVPLDDAGKEGPASFPMRTDPAFPRWATALVAEGGVRLTWQKSEAPDVAGYHIYRAPVPEQTAGNSWWDKAFNTRDFEGKLEKLTREPVKETEWLDTTARVQGPSGEYRWPATHAYVIRAVNAWGHEGGASPLTLALPDAPGPVTVVPWQDGRRLVLWAPPRAAGTEAYFVMRMDDWPGGSVFRWHPTPLTTFGFLDAVEFPTGDRRRYYVSGVDSMGSVGTPSSGAWSHGFP